MATSSTPSLPRGLSEVYLAYKRSTRIAITWLTAKSSATTQTVTNTATVSQLLELANFVTAPLPPEVSTAFQQAISLRQEMTSYFEQNHNTPIVNQTTARHKNFTDTLKQIYDQLSKTIVGSTNKRNNATPNRNERRQIARSLNKKPPMPNIYEHLPISGDLPSFAVDTFCDGTHVENVKQHGKVQQEVVGLAEDDLADVAQLFLALMNLDALNSILKLTWSRASRGEIPFFVAAVLSKAIFSWAANDSRSLLTTIQRERLALPWMRDCIDQFRELGNIGGWDDLDTPWLRDCTHKDGMYAPLLAFSVADDDTALTPQSRVFTPEDFVLHDGSVGFALEFCTGDDPALTTLHSSHTPADMGFFMTLLNEARAGTPTGSVAEDLMSTYPMRALQVVIEHRKNDPCSSAASAGIQTPFILRVLMESTRNYFRALDTKLRGDSSSKSSHIRKDKASPKLLRFVYEIIENIEDLITDPCTESCCEFTIGQQMAEAQQNLYEFAQLSRANLSDQLPLVAGLQMLNIWEQTQSLGIYLAAYRGYFAIVLHVYNALQRLGGFRRIQVLDELCELHLHSVFLGNLPSRGFASIFIRHIGGRADRSDNHNHSGGKIWNLSLSGLHRTVRDGRNEEPSAHRFESLRPIVTTIIGETGGQRSFEYWARVLRIPFTEATMVDDASKINHWLQKTPFDNHPLLHVQEALLDEYNGRMLPTCQPASHYCNSVKLAGPFDASWDSTGAPKLRFEHPNHVVSHYQDLEAKRLAIPAIRYKTLAETKEHAKTASSKKLPRITYSKLPVARLNYIKIWRACANAFATVNLGPLHFGKLGNPLSCKCLIVDLLEAVDKHLASPPSKRKPFVKSDQELLDAWKKVIGENFRYQHVDEFLWNNL